MLSFSARSSELAQYLAAIALGEKRMRNPGRSMTKYLHRPDFHNSLEAMSRHGDGCELNDRSLRRKPEINTNLTNPFARMTRRTTEGLCPIIPPNTPGAISRTASRSSADSCRP